MQAFWRRYLNEILGLLVMALMTVALVAGQVQAKSPQLAAANPANEIRHVVEVRLTFDGGDSSGSYAGL